MGGGGEEVTIIGDKGIHTIHHNSKTKHHKGKGEKASSEVTEPEVMCLVGGSI